VTWHQIDIPHHAGVVHLSMGPALRDFLAQIRQANIGAQAALIEPDL
jgi:hypothetical protein